MKPEPLAQIRPIEYRIWVSMNNRCYTAGASSNNYRNYQGRGITVCERWKSFAAFFEDMGPRPEGRSLDRIDNNGNYEPGNCRWATHREQCNNRRTNHKLEFNGRIQTIAEWAREIGLDRKHLRMRLVIYGWTIEKALTKKSIPRAKADR